MTIYNTIKGINVEKIKHNMIIMKKYVFGLIFILLLVNNAVGQVTYANGKVTVNGKVYTTMVVDGDTVILADLDPMSLSSPRSFESDEELKRYKKYKYFAAKVYPYAKDAINILNKIEERTKHMKPSKRKKYIKLTYMQLEHNFKTQLKKLSKTQGKILIKMIEKETNMTFFNTVKKMRNGFVAFYWHQFGKLYNYDLKEGYVEGKDRVLDAVLQDFDFGNDQDAVLNAQLLKKETPSKKPGLIQKKK